MSDAKQPMKSEERLQKLRTVATTATTLRGS